MISDRALGPLVNSPYGEGYGGISSDGLELYFSSDRPPGAADNWDIWITTRETPDDDWGTPVRLGPQLSTPYDEWIECISNDGLSLFLASNRPGGSGGYDLWIATRAAIDEDWGDPVNLGPTVNSSAHDVGVSISADGLTLFICSDRPGGYGNSDLWVTTRETTDGDWGAPLNLGPVMNEPSYEMLPFVSANGLCLLFSDSVVGPFRTGGLGDGDIWMTTQASKIHDWGVPVNLGPQINTTSWDGWPAISADASTLYFSSKRAGGLGGDWGDIWQAQIIPVVDLNGDGIVDAEDICIIVDHWGTDEPLCDIGPTPFGDGIVDVQDLIVLAEHLFEETTPVE